MRTKLGKALEKGLKEANVERPKGYFEAFKDAWENYPCQDNEGYQPDRGGFKAGWLAGIDWILEQSNEIYGNWHPFGNNYWEMIKDKEHNYKAKIFDIQHLPEEGKNET